MSAWPEKGIPERYARKTLEGIRREIIAGRVSYDESGELIEAVDWMYDALLRIKR